MKELVDDELNHRPHVERITRLLQAGTLPTVGILGPHGSGKTSVVCMAESSLRGSSVRYIRVRGWGVGDQGIADYVLFHLVQGLGALGLDCLAIRALPAAYAGAVSAVNEKAGALAQLACGHRLTPDQVVESVSPMLVATGLHAVVCIEDVDRNVSEGNFAALAGLLDRLKQCRNLTFILEKSTNGNRMDIEFSRFCDHMEYLPELAEAEVWNRLVVFEQLCRTQAGKGKVLTESRYFDLGVYEFSLAFVSSKAGEGRSRVETLSAVAKMAGTPRLLKLVMRRTLARWDRLAGEVDLLDLFLLSLLRESAPRVLDFLIARRHDIQLLHKGGSDAPDESRKRHAQLVQQLDESAAQDGVDAEVACAVLVLLGFPVHHDDPNLLGQKGPQAVCWEYATDYFARALTGGVLDPAELRDQVVLQDIVKWRAKAAQAPSIADLMRSQGGYAQKVAQFCNQLTPDDVRRLYEDYVRASVRAEGALAGDGSPAFKELLTVLDVHDHPAQIWGQDWLNGLIAMAAEGSLRMAVELYYHLGRTARGYLRGDPSVSRAFLAEQIRTRCQRDTRYLGQVLASGHAITLRQILRFHKGTSAYTSPAEWRWLVPSMVAALSQDADTMVPQLAFLFCNWPGSDEMEDRSIKGDEGYVFDADYFESLFADEVDRAALARSVLGLGLPPSLGGQKGRATEALKQGLMQYIPADEGGSGFGGQTATNGPIGALAEATTRAEARK